MPDETPDPVTQQPSPALAEHPAAPEQPRERIAELPRTKQRGPAMSQARIDAIKLEGERKKLERARQQLQDLKDAVESDGHPRIQNRAALEKRVQDLERKTSVS